MSSRSAGVRCACLVAVLWVAAAVVAAQDAPVLDAPAEPAEPAAPAAPADAQESAPADQSSPPAVALPVPVAPPPAAPPAEPYVEPQVEPASAASSPPASGGALRDTGEAAESDDEGEPEGEKLAWRGTSLYWDHTITKNTLVKDWQDNYNPTYVQAVGVRPRWYFSDTLSLRLRQDMQVELTQSDGDTEKQQLLFADTRIDLVEAKLYEWQEVVLRVGGTIRLPLSLTSQAEERIAGIGPIVGLSRDFEVLAGLTLDLSGGYRHNFGLSNVAHVERPYACTRAGDCDQARGSTNVSDSLNANFDATLAFVEQLALTLGTGGVWSLGYGLADYDFASNPRIIGASGTLKDQSQTHWRDSVDVHASLGYAPWKFLGIDLGLTTMTSTTLIFGRAARNPIWNPDTTLSLTFTLGIDELYLDASGRKGSDKPATPTNQQASRAAPSGT